MSELLIRGYNVALPFVDKGDDILTLEDEAGSVRRIQVKTRRAKSQEGSWHAQFKISRKQLEDSPPKDTELFYMFVLRVGESWRFLILARSTLHSLSRNAPGVRAPSDVKTDDLQVRVQADETHEQAWIWDQAVDLSWPNWNSTKFTSDTATT